MQKYVRGIYRCTTHSIWDLKSNVPKGIPVVFHNGSNYDYHFIEEIAIKSEGKIQCLGENMEKQRTFSVPIEKEVTKNDQDGNESIKTISWKIKSIDSARFMASSLSNVVDNLRERIHKTKCQDCDCFLEYKSVKDNLIKYNVYFAIKIIQTKLMKNLKSYLRTHLSFLIMISISSFCC